MGHRGNFKVRKKLLNLGFTRPEIEQKLKLEQKNRDLSRTQGFKIKRTAGIPLSIFDRQQEQKIKSRKRQFNLSRSNISQQKPIKLNFDRNTLLFIRNSLMRVFSF